MRVGIVLNPRHGRGVRAGHRLGRLLSARGARWRTMTTTEHRTGAGQARTLIDWGAEVLVVIGGDGTVRAVASEVAIAPVGPPGSGVPVAIVPTGSATVLARHLGIHSERAAFDLIADRLDGLVLDELAVPLNRAVLVDESGRRISGRFLLIAGMGGDAEAVSRKLSLPGPVGYVYGAMRALVAPTLVEPSITVPAGGDVEPAGPAGARPAMADAAGDGCGTWAVMASAVSHPAGPIAVFPEAELGATGFECLQVRVPERRRSIGRLGTWARIGAAALSGSPDDAVGMACWTAERLRVTVDRPARVHLDGDDIGPCTEMRLQAGTEHVRFLVP